MEPSQHHFVTAKELAEQFGGRIEGDSSTRVCRFSSLAKAHLGDAAFLASAKFADHLKSTRASLLIVREPEIARSAGLSCTLIITEDPYLYFAKAASWLIRRARAAQITATVISPSAVIDPTAEIGQRVRIGPNAVIGHRVHIGDDCDVGASCVIEDRARVGALSQLYPHVTIYRDCTIGARAIIHSGVVIGADGFGFAPQPDRSWMKIPQVGGVRIGDDVEIGANTTIDRGTLDDTCIGHGVKLDNQIQVAHNVVIGDHTAIAACVGIAGSAVIGRHCQIGGAAGILGHLFIADGVIIGPMSLVMSSIDKPGKYVGVYPLQPQSDWEKSAVMLRRLPQMRREIRDLIQRSDKG